LSNSHPRPVPFEGSENLADRFARALQRFDAINAKDPRSEQVDGAYLPRELAYARRMTSTLLRLDPDASEALRLSVRAQHLARWQIPRADFPAGRQGYKDWRTRLMDYHAELASEVLREEGYDEAMVEKVGQLLRKQGIKRNADVQTLEDVACLVFLEHYFDDFARQHDDAKLADIVRKTWAKMSDAGRQAALALPLSERAKRVVGRALAE
jgi:hypothetical protein